MVTTWTQWEPDKSPHPPSPPHVHLGAFLSLATKRERESKNECVTPRMWNSPERKWRLMDICILSQVFILSNFLFSFYMVSEQGEAVKPGSFTRLSLIRHLTLSDRNGDKNPTAWKVTLLGVWINSLEANQSAGCSVNTEVVTWLCQGSVERLAMQTADFSSLIAERSFLRIISNWWPSEVILRYTHVHKLKQILRWSVSFLILRHQKH